MAGGRRIRKRRRGDAAAVVRVLVEHPRGAGAGRSLADAGRTFLRRVHRSAELSIVLTTDRRIRRLNRRHRGVDRATDVLSFPVPGGWVLGDVVISLDAARREAARRRVPVRAELRRVLAHGLLHLLGFDHHRAADARAMAAAERRLLGSAGMVGDAAVSARGTPASAAPAAPAPPSRRPGPEPRQRR